MDANTGLSFARPEALLLLFVLVPLAVYLSRTSLAYLRPGRRRLSLALRVAIISLLVLALSGVSLVRAADNLSVVFLLDRSDSISAAQKSLQASDVRAAIASMHPNDQAGVIAFGADALVDRPTSPDKSPPDLASAPIGTYSNLADAIRLGLAISLADSARRLVLLSDGRENVGSAESTARLAAAHGAPIDVVPIPGPTGPEVWVDGLTAPSPVRESERVPLQISISSDTDTTATLTLLVDGAPLTSQPVQLTRGANTFIQDLPPATQGFHVYSAQIIPASGSDTRRENNRYSAYSLVIGKPHLLIVEGHEGEAASLQSALGQSMDEGVVTPAAVPDVKGLAGYDGVVLVNVPASSLSKGAMASLQTAVRDLGKGLVVVGGDESYAAGGYFRTPLEAMLPIDLNLPSKLDIPSVGMVLVIDRSGSMDVSHDVNGVGVKKIELAKEAAYQAVAQLSAKDYVGVVTFDSAANWVINLQPLVDPSQFKGNIGGITAGGGTNIYSGLAPAVDALAASKAKSKHIVLLTDGVSEEGDYNGLIKKMEANNITLSTVAVGADADTSLLKTLATAGKGRYYYTEDGDALPQIFAHESHLAARSYIIEHPFNPERTSPSPVLDGLGGLPSLLGYVGTSPRQGGQLVLVSDAGDPVLAQWQYGLGRVVAWTSDAKGQWAKQWVGWQDFARFWSQAVAWSTGSQSSNALQPHVEVEAGVAHVTVDASSPDGAFLNDLSASAVVVSPGLITSTVPLRQSAAGRYEGQFPATEEGAYLLQVQASGKDTGNIHQTLGVVVPYSPEYRGGESDNGLLARIASLTGGRVLSLDNLSTAFEHNLPAAKTSTDLWPALLLLAILLLPFDVGVRRVAVSRADAARAWEGLRRRLGWEPRRVVPALPHGSTPEIAALFGAKGRARDRIEPVASPPAVRAAEPLRAQDLQITGRVGRTVPTSQAEPPQQEQPVAATSEEESLAARLRRAREQRQ
jgi:Mg-chelatase subunit ChlD